MFLSLLKKEFKYFIRQKSNVVLLMVFPIILITTLSLGLKDLMDGGNNLFGSKDEPAVVYYDINSEKYADGFNEFKKGVKDLANIDFKESKLDKVKEEVDNYKAVAFLSITDNKFELYTSENGDNLESKVFKNMVDSMRSEFAGYETIAKKNPAAFANLAKSKIENVLEDKTKELRNPTSSEYYTFAELALIILYIAIVVSNSSFAEKKNTTINRIRLSRASELKMLLAKVVCGICIGIGQILIVYVYSSLVLDVNWGENTIPFMILFISLSVYASVSGAILGFIVNNEGTISGILNVVTILICGLGGSYMPLFELTSNPILNNICKISPLYWTNITTNSMVCGIETNAYYVALIFPILLSLLLCFVYLIFRKKKGVISNV